MSQSTRRRRPPRRVAPAAPVKSPTEHPTYDEEYFANDILLAEQPIANELTLEMLRFHRYITFRVGPELAVHFVNSEKLFNASTYGKELCSRMTKISNTKTYRVDFPDEEEEVFVNLMEWINNGLYTPYKDTFRGSFLRHLKLYALALKYGVEELTEFIVKVIADMLVESHPEQVTRALFWSAVENLVYKCTASGDEMRSVITGYTMWYSQNGRAKGFRTKKDTVENALLALTKLSSTSPFYRIGCDILHENPEYFEEKLNGYFGDSRSVDPKTTRWWKDHVEDPLFERWMIYWKTASDGGQTHGSLDWCNHEDNAEMIKGVDEEDKVLLGGEEEKEAVPKNGAVKGGKSKSKSKSKAIKTNSRARAAKLKGMEY